MQNYEQIRAAAAYSWRDKVKPSRGEGKPSAVTKKVATMIVQNGFLATFAFALSDAPEHPGHKSVFKGIFTYLLSAEADLGLSHLGSVENLQVVFKKLTADGIMTLRLVTDEALAYLVYLRRFVPDPKEK